MRVLKQQVAKHINLSRFRQRLLTESGELLDDAVQLNPPLNLQLVKLDWLRPDYERDMDFIDACEEKTVANVEDMLCRRQDPNTVFDDGYEHVTALHLAAYGAVWKWWIFC